MIRTYGVKYKSKSKMLTTKEAIEGTEKQIMEVEFVKSAKVTQDGQVVAIEADDEEKFGPIMDKVINIFRRIDEKSEVSYSFKLNKDNY